jgi:high-affinity nickel permease
MTFDSITVTNIFLAIIAILNLVILTILYEWTKNQAKNK